MDKKQCSKCDEVKPMTEYHKNKQSPDGHQPRCKACFKQYNQDNKEAIAEQKKQYRQDNKEAIAEQKKQYNQDNKEAIAERHKQHYQDNKEAIAERHKQYNQDNKEAIAERKKQHYQDNKGAIAEKGKQYRQDNKEAIAERHKQYNQDNKEAIAERQRGRIANDPLFRLTHNIRCLIRNSLRNGGYNKKSKTAEILGCTFKKLHRHIESQFTDGMSWDLMSDIHIDHRLPLSAASTEEEVLALNHHRNLQPMWATDNMAKSDNHCPLELATYFKKHLNS